MDRGDSHSAGPLKLQDLERLVALCDRFERGWLRVPRLKIEDLIGEVDLALRSCLLYELLALELELRRQSGECPVIQEYRSRFPAPEEQARIVAAFRMDRQQDRGRRPQGKCQDGAGPTNTFHKQSGRPGWINAAWEGSDEPDVISEPPSDTCPIMVQLEVVRGPHAGRKFEFRDHDMFVVGRSSQAHFRLPRKDKTISRYHFMIETNPPQCRLMDMASTNGTFVDGIRVDVTNINDGSSIRAGRTTLSVRIARSPAEAGSAVAPDGPACPRVPTSSSLLSDCRRGEPERADVPVVPSYEILREIGRGGMGVVYHAQSQRDGSHVALKTIIPAVAGSEGVMARFLREANVLRRLDHSHIVRFLEIGSAEGRIFFVMEYAPGLNADELLKRRGPLPVDMAVNIACQALDGLAYAHAKGFVHRDIKPQNLLITRVDGRLRVKLADFGLARVYQNSPLSGLTMTGNLGGTIKFMPPEQVTDFREARPPADQYSVGATLYYLLTGEPSLNFPKERRSHLVTILNEAPVPIRDRRPEIPAELASIIHRTLEKKPSRRFRDAKSLRSHLLAFSEGLA